MKSYRSSALLSGVKVSTYDGPPIRFVRSPTGCVQSSVTGMRVAVTNLDCGPGTLRCTVVVDNLVKGAAGAALQIMEYVEYKGRVGWEDGL